MRGGTELLGEDPGLDPRPLPVDLHTAHPLCLDQDLALERPERGRPVPGALRRDFEVVLIRERDGLRDVVGALDERDRLRVLIGDQVPGGAGLVPIRVIGHGDAPRDREPCEIRHRANPMQNRAANARRDQAGCGVASEGI